MAYYTGSDPNQLKTLMSSDYTINSETIMCNTAGLKHAVTDLINSDTPALVISDPIITGSSNVIVGMSNTFTLSASSGLNGVTISEFKASITGQSEQTITATSGSGTVTFTVPSETPIGTLLTISVIAYDSLGNPSNTTSKSITVVSSYIEIPTIIVPIENANVTISSGTLNVISSTFNVLGSTDTHSATDWKITSDVIGNTIIKSAFNSTDLTSHTFTGLTSSNGTIFYLWVRYKGTMLGWSEWSPVRIISVTY